MKVRRFSLGITILVIIVAALFGVVANTRAAAICTPATAITVPFAKDGVGDFCYVTSSLCTSINSWNMTTVEVNGTAYTNVWVSSPTIPAVGGTYTIHYVSTVAWSHFEIAAPCSGVTPVPTTQVPGITNTPTRTPTRTLTPAISLTPTRTVSPTSTNGVLPDLTITSITYVGSSPACMNSPRDNVVVSNIGSANAGTFVVSFNTQTQTVSGLTAGQSVTLSFNAVSSATATADSTQVIAETNEANNSLTAQLPIPTQAFTCTPTSGISLTPTRTPTRTRTPTQGTGPSLTPTRTITPPPAITLTPTRTNTPTTGPVITLTPTATTPAGTNYLGNATWFTNLGMPYGGCGITQSALDTPHFVALNVQNSPGDYTTFLSRPISSQFASQIGLWNNGHNCGRWVRVTISDYCTGVNDGAQNQPFCRNGSWVADAYNGATLDMIIADSCHDGNAWCRDDPYHVDLAEASLNQFVKNGVPVGDMNPLHWGNRHVNWQFIPAPNYTGDIEIAFIEGGQIWWPAIAVNHLANGIHGVDYFANGVWTAATMNADMGQSFIIAPLTSGGNTYQLRVYDVNDQLINGGRIYSFAFPASCGSQCSTPYNEVTYTTSQP